MRTLISVVVLLLAPAVLAQQNPRSQKAKAQPQQAEKKKETPAPKDVEQPSSPPAAQPPPTDAQATPATQEPQGTTAGTKTSARPALAVMDFVHRGVTPMEANAAGRAVVRGLRELDVFEVLSPDDTRDLLALERTKELLGSAAEDFGPLREAAGARHVVSGSLAKVAEQWTLEIRLLDTADGRVINQKILGPVARLDEVLKGAPGVAQELMAPLLDAQRGALRVRVSEEAAEIVVDDLLRGSSPFNEDIPLSRGSHRLTVRKDGFIAKVQPVRITPGELTVEDVQLVPSPDYAEAWKVRYGRLRTAAWITTGAAVLTLGGAVLANTQAATRYDAEFVPRQRALADRPFDGLPVQTRGVYDGCLAAGRTLCTEQIEAAKNDVQNWQYATVGLAAVGLGAATAAVYLWTTGEDPNRYSNLVLSAAPSRSGGAAVLSGRF